MNKTIIVPGLAAKDSTHWTHWWAKVDPDARMAAEDHAAGSGPQSADTAIASAILIHPGSVLVGYGSGAAAVLRVLRRWPNLKVAGAILVAPLDVDHDHQLRVPSTIVASRNDPDLTFTRASCLARSLGSGLVDLGFAGRIDAESGFGPWPCGIELRDEMFFNSHGAGLCGHSPRIVPIATSFR